MWNLEAYGFLDQECPDTANPSLWRQSRLCSDHGLFEVTEGIYQVRGFDLSNMTIVEGERGVLIIDPLLCAETAAAGLALYRSHRGERPVTGLLYTHSHADHFGGVRGVLSDEDVANGVPVFAPQGFLEHAVRENVYAGTAMSRRAAYMYGAALPKGERGQIGAGLGQTLSTGTVGLIPPTADITRTGQTETVDGIRMVFQLTPGTEAPAELNIHFPDRSALRMAENATCTICSPCAAPRSATRMSGPGTSPRSSISSVTPRTWRNFYLMGALELRHGSVGTPTSTVAPDLLAVLTLDQLCDALAIRVDGPRSWDADITVRWKLSDGEPLTLRLRNGVLTHVTGSGRAAASPDVEICLTEAEVRAVLLGVVAPADLAARPAVEITGDVGKLTELLGHLSDPDPDFAIVTP